MSKPKFHAHDVFFNNLPVIKDFIQRVQAKDETANFLLLNDNLELIVAEFPNNSPAIEVNRDYTAIIRVYPFDGDIINEQDSFSFKRQTIVERGIELIKKELIEEEWWRCECIYATEQAERRKAEPINEGLFDDLTDYQWGSFDDE